MSDSRDEAAIIGAGGAGLLHALALRAHGVSIGAIFDPDRARAENLAAISGGHACSTLDELAESAARFVSICSPPVMHVAQAEACARAERVLFVEKPVAITRPELARLSHLPNVVPIVQWRSGRGIRFVRHAIRRGFLGDALTISIDLAWQRDAAYFASGRDSQRLWGCGALLSVGIHALDAACFAMGRGIRDIACFRLDPANGDVEKAAVLVGNFDGGTLFSLRITFDTGDEETRLAFAGNALAATITGSEMDATASEVRFTGARASEVMRTLTREANVGGASAPPLLVPFIGAALDAVREGRSPGTCDALPSMLDVIPAHDAIMRAYAMSPLGSRSAA